jgi:hypothetical protein
MGHKVFICCYFDQEDRDCVGCARIVCIIMSQCGGHIGFTGILSLVVEDLYQDFNV